MDSGARSYCEAMGVYRVYRATFQGQEERRWRGPGEERKLQGRLVLGSGTRHSGITGLIFPRADNEVLKLGSAEESSFLFWVRSVDPGDSRWLGPAAGMAASLPCSFWFF